MNIPMSNTQQEMGYVDEKIKKKVSRWPDLLDPLSSGLINFQSYSELLPSTHPWLYSRKLTSGSLHTLCFPLLYFCLCCFFSLQCFFISACPNPIFTVFYDFFRWKHFFIPQHWWDPLLYLCYMAHHFYHIL